MDIDADLKERSPIISTPYTNKFLSLPSGISLRNQDSHCDLFKHLKDGEENVDINKTLLQTLRRGSNNSTTPELKETEEVEVTENELTPPNREEEEELLDIFPCSLCKHRIENKYLLYALEKYWHEKCLKCDFCRKPLYKSSNRFYYRQGAKFCREDFLRTFGKRGVCSMCDQIIPPTEYVLRFKGDLVYHLECFKCVNCHTQFCVGDPVSISDPKYILCKNCRYISHNYVQEISHIYTETSKSSVASKSSIIFLHL